MHEVYLVDYTCISLAIAEKHLLDSYAAHLHLFIRSAISQGRDYTTADLIQQWRKEKTPSDDDFDNESSSPPRKKRFVSKAKESNANDSLRRSNKDKTQQKKSIAASAMLASQEIITVTQYNDVFPVISAPRNDHPQQQQQFEQQ